MRHTKPDHWTMAQVTQVLAAPVITMPFSLEARAAKTLLGMRSGKHTSEHTSKAHTLAYSHAHTNTQRKQQKRNTSHTHTQVTHTHTHARSYNPTSSHPGRSSYFLTCARTIHTNSSQCVCCSCSSAGKRLPATGHTTPRRPCRTSGIEGAKRATYNAHS